MAFGTVGGALAKEDAHAAQLDLVLATLADGLRLIGVLLHPWLPETVDTLFAAIGVEDLALSGAHLQPGKVTRVERMAPMFPKPQDT